MMIEDGDANDLDFIIWYWLDLYAPGGSHSTRRVRYNRAAAMQDTRGELIGDLSVPRSFTESQRC
jgi:hypothetical protein